MAVASSDNTVAGMKRLFTQRHMYYNDIAKFNNDAWQVFQHYSKPKCVQLHESRVVERDLGKPSVPGEKLERSFQTWLKDIKTTREDMSYRFRDVRKRLSANKLGSEGRKNADLREFRCFEGLYMVKKFFTLGFKDLGDKCYDLLVTTNKGVDIHLLRPGEASLESDGLPECGEDRFLLKRVPAHTLELLTPGTKYILIAPDKCIFYYGRFTDKSTLYSELGIEEIGDEGTASQSSLEE